MAVGPAFCTMARGANCMRMLRGILLTAKTTPLLPSGQRLLVISFRPIRIECHGATLRLALGRLANRS